MGIFSGLNVFGTSAPVAAAPDVSLNTAAFVPEPQKDFSDQLRTFHFATRRAGNDALETASSVTDLESLRKSIADQSTFLEQLQAQVTAKQEQMNLQNAVEAATSRHADALSTIGEINNWYVVEQSGDLPKHLQYQTVHGNQTSELSPSLVEGREGMVALIRKIDVWGWDYGRGNTVPSEPIKSVTLATFIPAHSAEAVKSLLEEPANIRSHLLPEQARVTWGVKKYGHSETAISNYELANDITSESIQAVSEPVRPEYQGPGHMNGFKIADMKQWVLRQ